MPAEPPITIKLHGIDELRKKLQGLPRNLQRKGLTKALRAAGKVVLQAAREKAPLLSEEEAARNKRRKRGTVKRNIALRVSKRDRRDGNVGVFIAIKPAKAAARGTANPNDPYYWRWVEFGHRIVPRKSGLQARTAKRGSNSLTGRRRNAKGFVPAQPFMRPAADRLEEAKRVFEREAIPAIAELNK